MNKVFILHYYAAIFTIHPQSNIKSVKHTVICDLLDKRDYPVKMVRQQKLISSSSNEHSFSSELFESFLPKSQIILVFVHCQLP